MNINRATFKNVYPGVHTEADIRFCTNKPKNSLDKAFERQKVTSRLRGNQILSRTVVSTRSAFMIGGENKIIGVLWIRRKETKK